MRYIIHGAGAVGCLVGGLLAANGAEVIFIGRPEHAEAINQRGVKILAPQGSSEKDIELTNVKAVVTPHAINPQSDDVIMLAVKSAQVAHSAQVLREVFNERTPVFCLQNGIRSEEMVAQRFLSVYGLMVGLGVTLVEPGVVVNTFNRYFALGNYPLGCDELVQTVAAHLAHPSFSVSTHNNVMSVKWAKLILNLNNAFLAVTDCYVQLARVLPKFSSFMADIYAEGMHVLDVAGISTEEPGNPFDLKAIVAHLRSVGESAPDEEKIREARELPEHLRAHVSTWFDLKNQRGETEVSYLTGEIILLGEKYGVPTPYNSVLLRVAEQMAAEKQLPGRYTIEELEEMVQQKRLEIYSAGE
ncbi:MAG TPA: 2-dehydropantoate 2-reductase [Blastocatellia bacterium]|nr:2-dehydropantoate 2-reductase [Blastocatellia bacterium]